MATYGEWLSGRGFSPDTIRARITLHDGRTTAWGPLAQVPVHTIAGWLAGYSGWTKLTYHGHLTSIFEWLVEQGELERNPMRGIKRPPTPRPRPKPLSDGEAARVLMAADARQRAWLLLGSLAGLRAAEIARVHGSQVTERTLEVLGKGGQLWALPTHPALWQLAQRYPRDGFWFPSTKPRRDHVSGATVTRSIAVLFASQGVAGATHRARHRYGTQLVRGGTNLRVVQELMRHASLATTALYLGVDEEERQAAILRLVA